MSGEYSELLNRVLEGSGLTETEASELMHAMAGGEMEPALAGALLAGLRAKGESADEIRGFAKAMRALATKPASTAGVPTA